MKKTTVKHIVTFSYNVGMLGAEKSFDTEEEARAFAEKYKNGFEVVTNSMLLGKSLVQRDS